MVPRSCWITFHVEFAFQRATYNHVVSLFFSEVGVVLCLFVARASECCCGVCLLTKIGKRVSLSPSSGELTMLNHNTTAHLTTNHSPSLTHALPQVTRRMMSAFEGRCEELYGPSALVRNIRPPLRPRDRGYHSQGEQTCHQRHQHQHQELCTSSKQQGMARRG